MLFIWYFEETRKPLDFNIFKLSYMTTRCVFGNENYYELLYVPDSDFCYEIRYHQLLMTKNCIFNISKKINVLNYWMEESKYVDSVYIRNDILLKPFQNDVPICEQDEIGIRFAYKSLIPKKECTYSIKIETNKYCPHTRLPNRGFDL